MSLSDFSILENIFDWLTMLKNGMTSEQEQKQKC